MPWLLRWVLVVVTLAGLGVWQGGHCANDMSAGPIGHRDEVATALVTDIAAAHQPATGAHRHDDARSPTRHGQPDTTADPCQDVTVAVTATAVTATLPQCDSVRTAVTAPRVPPVKQRVIPGVTLTHIGVSRT